MKSSTCRAFVDFTRANWGKYPTSGGAFTPIYDRISAIQPRPRDAPRRPARAHSNILEVLGSLLSFRLKVLNSSSRRTAISTTLS